MTREWIVFQAGATPIKGWRLALAVILGVALLAGVAAIAFAAFVVLFPVVAALALWGRWRWRKAMREAALRQTDIIEAEYTVLPPGGIERR